VSDVPPWATILLFAWAGVTVASWFGGIVEAMLALRLWPPVFRVGHVVLREPYSISPEDRTRLVVGQVYATSRGKFRLTSRNEIVFCESFWGRFGQWHTPFPIKGRVTWAADLGETSGSLEGRIPLASTVFVGSILAFVTAVCAAGMFGMFELTAVGGRLGILATAAFFWVFLTGMYLISVRIELPRIRGVAQEIRERLSPDR